MPTRLSSMAGISTREARGCESGGCTSHDNSNCCVRRDVSSNAQVHGGSGIYFEDHEVPLPATLAGVPSRKRPHQVLHGRPMMPPPALFNAFHLQKKRCVSPVPPIATVTFSGGNNHHHLDSSSGYKSISKSNKAKTKSASCCCTNESTEDGDCREAALTLASFCCSNNNGASSIGSHQSSQLQPEETATQPKQDSDGSSSLV